jgi:hypothetical protein
VKENTPSAFPIIKLEVETMRQAMHAAFSQQLIGLDEMFRVAVEDACNPEKVQKLLTEAANKYIREATKQATADYFMNGEGRKLIVAKVKERLKLGENCDE